MTRKLMIVLALLVAVTCVPVQATKGKSTGTIVWNSIGALLGTYLLYCGIKDFSYAKRGGDFIYPINGLDHKIPVGPSVGRALFNGTWRCLLGATALYVSLDNLTKSEEGACLDE